MPGDQSLFAAKLKRHRLEAGAHGRMTQEQLAEVLGVSLDAISKYERSLSFIRGDLEPRLGERLGWSRDEVLACREDWEGRRGNGGGGYRLLDAGVLGTVFDGSWEAASAAAIEFSAAHFTHLPPELAADSGAFQPMNAAYPQCWSAVVLDGRFVAKWCVFPSMPEVEAQFRAGELMEDELTVDSVRQPILPGTYFGYCPALVVAPGHERASAILLSSFVEYLEGLARRDVLFHGIGTISCSPGGAQISRDLGMVFLGEHVLGKQFGLWELTGAGIARSIFAKKSAVVREAYARAFL